MDPVERLSTDALLDEAECLKTTYEAALRELPDESVQFGAGRFDEALSRYFDVSNELRMRRGAEALPMARADGLEADACVYGRYVR